MAVKCVRCPAYTTKPTWTAQGHLCEPCASGSLDAALTDAEDLLPERWAIHITPAIIEEEGWLALARPRGVWMMRNGPLPEIWALGPTRPAAVRALVSKLRERAG